MSLGRSSPRRMDLAAFALGEVEADRRPGVFRHRRSLRALLARVRGEAPAPVPEPQPEPDPFVWHAIADLLPIGSDD